MSMFGFQRIMNRILGPVLLIVLVICVAGCGGSVITVGRRFEIDQANEVARGKTSKTEILKKFGRPSLGLNAGRPNEAMVYGYNRGSKDSFNLGIFLVVFDENGVVRDYYTGYQSSEVERNKPKETSAPQKLSDEATRLIQNLLASDDSYKKISAVVLAKDNLMAGSLGFLQGFLQKQLETEQDPTVRAVYLWALDEFLKDETKGSRLVELVTKYPSIIPDLKKKNVIALAGVVDDISNRPNDEAAIRFIFGHLKEEEFREIFSDSAKEIFDKSFEQVLPVLSTNSEADLKVAIEVLGLKRNLQDLKYLKLQYYALTKDPKLGVAAKIILKELPQ